MDYGMNMEDEYGIITTNLTNKNDHEKFSIIYLSCVLFYNTPCCLLSVFRFINNLNIEIHHCGSNRYIKLVLNIFLNKKKSCILVNYYLQIEEVIISVPISKNGKLTNFPEKRGHTQT